MNVSKLGLSALALVACECLLRLSGIVATISENRGSGYRSEYGAKHNGWLHVNDASTEFVYRTTEFDHLVTTNTEGIRDLQHPVAKPAGEYRVVTLGDSFTEGVGAPFDSSYVSLLRDLLQRNSHPLSRIINGGVSGSDPYYCHNLLTQRLYKYQPDLVILSINTSDVDDVIFRGGDERFLPDGTTMGKESPWWEFMYAKSHLIRLMFRVYGINDDLIQNSKKAAIDRAALNSLISKIIEIHNDVNARGMQFVLIAHPTADECASKQFRYPKFFFDKLQENNVVHFNLFDDMCTLINSENYLNYSWKLDMHYNASGYLVLANTIYRKINPFLPKGAAEAIPQAPETFP